MTDRRTWLPVVGVAALVGVITLLVVLGRPAIDVEHLDVEVGEADGSVSLDAALYLPADAARDDPRPAVLLAHGFLGDRTSSDERARRLAGDGFVVLAWSARGYGASGGQVGLADPAAEIADVSALVDLLATRPEVLQDAPGDPRVGIVGGSYGAGTALLAAGQDPRLDAVVAAAGWNSLSRSLAPNGVLGPEPVASGVLKASWTSLLFTANALPGDLLDPPADQETAPPDLADPEAARDGGIVATLPVDDDDGSAAAGICGRFTAEICDLYLEVAGGGLLTDAAHELLDARSPAGRLGRVEAPTLLVQGQDDTLFDLTESRRNAAELAAGGTPVRLRWVSGGHEVVGGAGTPETDEELDAWLDRWLRDAGTDAAPTDPDASDVDATDGESPMFSWTDTAAGAVRDGDRLPTDTGEVLRLEFAADGSLAPPDDGGDARTPSDEVRGVAITAPPGGLPAAFSALPGGTALTGFLPINDIPGQHIALDSAPMAADTTVLGPPRLQLTVDAAPAATATGTSDEARLFVKLADVAPDGVATLLQQAVTPVRTTSLPAELDAELPDLAYRLRAGHRLRVTVAATDQAFANRDDAASTTILLGGGVSSITLPRVDSVPDAGGPPWIWLVVGLALATGGATLLRARLRRPVDAATDARPMDAARPHVAVGEPAPIVIRGLTKRYADGHLAVDGLDLTVGTRQVVGLLGPNGAGKTTSLRMLLGLSRPSAGTIELFGQRVRPGHPVLRRVGALVEGPGFVPELSGMDNLGLYWRAGGEAFEDAELSWALSVADLGDAVRKPVRTYSHGMKQRLAIAQALLGRPELLVLDEPTDGLDPEQIRGMRELLARLGDEGHTVLVSSHLLAEVEQMCTHAAIVQRGRLLASGSMAELVGGTRTVVVETDDRDRTRQVLAGHLGEEAVQTSGAGLAVVLGEIEAADVVGWLVTAGLRIQALTPRGKLEDAFLSLTGEPASPHADPAAGHDTTVRGTR